jgi:hypothetical protein
MVSNITGECVLSKIFTGGIQLGQMRFKHITDLTTEILIKFQEQATNFDFNVSCFYETNQKGKKTRH